MNKQKNVSENAEIVQIGGHYSLQAKESSASILVPEKKRASSEVL